MFGAQPQDVAVVGDYFLQAAPVLGFVRLAEEGVQAAPESSGTNLIY